MVFRDSVFSGWKQLGITTTQWSSRGARWHPVGHGPLGFLFRSKPINKTCQPKTRNDLNGGQNFNECRIWGCFCFLIFLLTGETCCKIRLPNNNNNWGLILSFGGGGVRTCPASMPCLPCLLNRAVGVSKNFFMITWNLKQPKKNWYIHPETPTFSCKDFTLSNGNNYLYMAGHQFPALDIQTSPRKVWLDPKNIPTKPNLRRYLDV